VGGLPEISHTVSSSDPTGAKSESVSAGRIKTYKVDTSGFVEVTGTIGATVTATTTDKASGKGSVTCSYSASLSSVRLQRDGQDINDNNNKVLPGESINLSVLGASGTGLTYEWSQPDNMPFKDYNTAATGGNQLVQLAPADFTQPGFTFHYTFGDDAKHKVSCKTKVNGMDTVVEDELTVVKPVCETPEPEFGGTVHYEPDQTAPLSVGLFGIDPPPGQPALGGINWKSKVWITNQGLGGTFCHVQLIKPRRIIHTEPDNGPPVDITDPLDPADLAGIFLDNTFPYGGSSSTGTNSSMNFLPGDDNPGFTHLDEVESNHTILSTGYKDSMGTPTPVEEEFTVYLMFKPSGTGACWVPLQSFKWRWKMRAEQTLMGWQDIVKADCTYSADAATVAYDHPLWKSVHVSAQ